ncbi:hypothetical protein COCON_G00114980 [Conger conger]|uniref:Ig-like domain-containing protein n=1 Tax=Conger conger TaxID=82655 RepID=A0A9Q1DFT4_CONCO|nr:hypothetical protein COCON_G00114980 [Conger conger]
MLQVFSSFSSQPVGSSGAFGVRQTPQTLDALEGDSVTMICSWEQANANRVRVVWRRADLPLPEQTAVVQQGRQDSMLAQSTLSIPGVALKDAGTYYCTVTMEIPEFQREEGSGTSLTVKTDEHYAQGASVEEVLIFIVRCLPFLALLTAVFCLCRIEAKAADRAPESSGREEENEAENEPATSLLEAADAEVVGGRIVVPCPTPSSGQPETENETITPVIS